MCGLFGIVSSTVFHDFEKDAFRKISFLSSVRGIDSTGYIRIAGVPGKTPAYANFIKSAKDPISFSKQPEVRDFLRPSNLFALLGHTRAATKGSVTTINAHPFLSKCGRFTVFHNGTLNNTHTDYETDSEWLTNKISEARGNLDDVLPDVSGAYALVIWDNQEKTVSLVRNAQRPLFIGRKGNWKRYYASEPWMLQTAFNLQDTEIFELPVNKMITLKYDERMDFEETEVQVKTYKPFQGRVNSSNAYGSSPYWENYDFWESSVFEGKLAEELGENREKLTLPRKTEEQKQKPDVYGPLVPVVKGQGTSPMGNLDPSLFEQKTNEKDGKSSKRKGGQTTNVVPFRNRNMLRTRLTNSGDMITEFYLAQCGFSDDDINVILTASEEVDIDTESIADMIENGIMNFGEDYLPTKQELDQFVTFYLSKSRAVTLHNFKNLVSIGCGVCGRDFSYDEMRNWSDLPGAHFSCFGNCNPMLTINNLN